MKQLFNGFGSQVRQILEKRTTTTFISTLTLSKPTSNFFIAQDFTTQAALLIF